MPATTDSNSARRPRPLCDAVWQAAATKDTVDSNLLPAPNGARGSRIREASSAPGPVPATAPSCRAFPPPFEDDRPAMHYRDVPVRSRLVCGILPLLANMPRFDVPRRAIFIAAGVLPLRIPARIRARPAIRSASSTRLSARRHPPRPLCRLIRCAGMEITLKQWVDASPSDTLSCPSAANGNRDLPAVPDPVSPEEDENALMSCGSTRSQSQSKSTACLRKAVRHSLPWHASSVSVSLLRWRTRPIRFATRLFGPSIFHNWNDRR